MKKFSHSEVESFTTCERRHYYGYGLGLQSRVPSDALVRGSMGHMGLEYYFKAIQAGAKDHASLKSEARKGIYTYQQENGEINPRLILEVTKLVDGYVDFYWERDITWEILAVEQEFNIPVNDGFYIKMIVDLIANTYEGITAVDNKFVYNFYGPVELGLNPQLVKYKAALMSEGYRIDRLVYNQIRYRVTKDQEDDPNARYLRSVVHVNNARLNQTVKEQLIAAERIAELKELPIDEWEKRVVRTSSSVVCERCPFKTICAMDLEGKDTSIAVDFGFKKRE